MRRRLNAQEREWKAKHEKQLPKMSDGKRGMQYKGGTGELDRVGGSQSASPRCGSHVYVDGYFTIVTGYTKFGRKLEGAPTMPIKQWLHNQAKRGPKSVKQ